MFGVVISALIAAQVPLPADETPSMATTRTEALVFDRARRAAEVCGYEAGSWSCRELERFNVLVTAATEHPAHMTARVRPLTGGEDPASPDCMTGLTLEITHPTAEVAVDWSRATLAVDGVARQVVPGFARQGTAGLEQRKSVAAAGTTLVESVHAIDGSCLASVAPDASDARLVLRVPVSAGGTEYPVSSTILVTRETMTEADALASLAVPPEQDSSGWHWWGTAIPLGIGAGLAGGLAVILAVGAALPGGNATLLIAAPVMLLVGTLVYGGCPALCGWVFLDRPAQARQAKAEAANERRAALLEQRRALGIDDAVAY